MAQSTDLVVPNTSGAGFRSGLNTRLQAIATHQSGNTSPTTTYPYQFWADTLSGFLKQRDGSNTNWVNVGTMGAVNLGLASLASPAFTGTPTAPTAAAGTNTTQLATTAFVATATSGRGGLRNRIINGGMAINQRNGSGTATIAASSATAYVLDRWNFFSQGSAVTVTRTTGNETINFIMAVSGAAGNTIVLIGQNIEKANSMDLAGKQCTLSWSSLRTNSANIEVYIAYCGTDDVFSSGTVQLSSTSIAQTSSFADYSVTFTLPAAATKGVRIEFRTPSLLAGQSFQLANVQLEQASSASSFERRPIGVETLLCQRYFWRPVTSWTHQAFGNTSSSSTVFFPFPTEMRATPTITAAWGSLVAASAGSIAAINTSSARATLTRTDASTGDYAGAITWTSFDAEL